MNEDKNFHLLNQKLRKIFSEHVFYTRLYIINELLDLKGDVPLIARLVKNQEDIGSIFRECNISISDSNEIIRLFKEHIYIAADLVKLIKSGDVIQQTEVSTRWHMNAVGIAEFINSIVPNCDRSKLRDMLFEHTLLTQEEISDYFYKMYEQSIVKFDMAIEQVLIMADYLSECLSQIKEVSQFTKEVE